MTDDLLAKIDRTLVCPDCHGRLASDGAGLACGRCGLAFTVNGDGYLGFVMEQEYARKVSTTEVKAVNQSSSGADRIDDEYVMPWLEREPFSRVLDVGCGVGRIVSKLLDAGVEAYGVDLDCLSGFWSNAGNDPAHFFHSEATRLPFPDGYFDVVMSMGVIEHIGTGRGHCTLPDDYRQLRQRYADELLRVTRRGGRILISCPNKHFPVDHQHEVCDMYSRPSLVTGARERIFRMTGLNVHQTWGRYHLLSYGEVKQLFCGSGNGGQGVPAESGGRGRGFRALPLDGYFGFSRLRRGPQRVLAPLAGLYAKHMPAFMRSSFLNPYLLAEIRK